MPVINEQDKNICESIGRNILADNTPQSLALMAFLDDAFQYSFNRPAGSACDYDYVWSLFTGHREKDPDDPTAIEFNEVASYGCVFQI